MSEIVTRNTKGSQLSIAEGDAQIGEINLTYSSTTLTLDETHNREHIILQTGCTQVRFTATATLDTNLNAIDASNNVGWYVKISNNSGSTVTINDNGLQFNGGTSIYYLQDNMSVIIGFDNVSSTLGYFIISEYSLIHEVRFAAESVGTSTQITKALTGTIEKIDVTLLGVSQDDALGNFPRVNLGTGGSLTPTGSFGRIVNGETGDAGDLTSTGWSLSPVASASQTWQYTGHIHFERVNGNNWIGTGIIHNIIVPSVYYISGNITLAGACDIVGITAGGSNNFDAGQWRVTYWYT